MKSDIESLVALKADVKLEESKQYVKVLADYLEKEENQIRKFLGRKDYYKLARTCVRMRRALRFLNLNYLDFLASKIETDTLSKKKIIPQSFENFDNELQRAIGGMRT